MLRGAAGKRDDGKDHFIGVRTGIAPIIGLHWAFVLAFVVLCVFFADCNRNADTDSTSLAKTSL
jgi:hypothetical protein